MVVDINELQKLYDPSEFDLSDHASVAVVFNDTHANWDYFDKGLEKASKEANGKKFVAFCSDNYTHTDRPEIARKLGYKNDVDVMVNNIASVVENKDDRDAVEFVLTIDAHGQNYFRNMYFEQGVMPDEKIINDHISRYQKIVKEKGNLLKKVYGSLDSKEMNQKIEAEKFDNGIKRISLDRAIDKYLGEERAKRMDKHPNCTFIDFPGNHDSTNAMFETYKAVKNKANYKISDSSVGLINIGDMKVQATGNVFELVNQTDGEIYGKDGVDQLYPHMAEQNNYIVKDLDSRIYNSLTKEDALNSTFYKRATKNGSVDEKADALILHSEMGKALGFENRDSPYGYADEVGVAYFAREHLKDNAKIYCGHIHSQAEGKNTLGQNVSRNRGIILSKYGQDIKETKLEQVRDVPAKYDFDKIKSYAQDFEKEIRSQMNSAAEDYSYQESNRKAA